MKLTKEMILEFLKEHKNEFKEKYAIDKIGLFGSYSRDEANENSDIDLVIHTKVKKFRNRNECKKQISEMLQKDVDLGYFDSLKSYIQKDIQKDLIYV